MRTILPTILLITSVAPGQLFGQAPDPSRQPLDSVLQSFCQTIARDRGNAAAWFGIGKAQWALARANFPVRPSECHTEGTSYLQDAGIAFARALDADPTFPNATDELADVIELNPKWGSGSLARNAFRRAASRGARESPRVLLLRARLEREGGERDSTTNLLDRYLASGGDSGVGLYERARERFFRGDRDGALNDYWAATARTESQATYFLVRKNLALIALPGEMTEFDATMSIDRLEWVRRFWTRRDVEAGLHPGDRLVEHFRRYEISRRGFRPVGLGIYTDTLTAAQKMSQALINQVDSAGAATDTSGSIQTDRLWGDQSLLPGRQLDANEFGARGLLYMRHGEPDDMAGLFWVYRRNGRDLIVPVDGGGYPGGACNLAPKYCGYEPGGRRVPPEVAKRWNAEWDTTFGELVTSDDYIPRFKRDLHPSVRVYAFPKTETSSGRILLTLATPGSELTPVTTTGKSVYQLHIGMVLAPATGEFRQDLDTTRTLQAPGRLGRQEFLQLSQEMEVEPGFYGSRLTLTNPERNAGIALAMDSLDVGDGTAELSMSDLILGKESSGYSWWSGRNTVFLNPLGTISRTEPLRLYYMVAGLVSGSGYSSEVELFRSVGASRKAALRLAFNDKSEDSSVETERIIGLDRLQPGPYTIQVTIRGEGGTTVSRRGVLVITK